ncbi:lupus la ribonucleoprotein, putative [Entamoeba dispar SAW760]|uniref:Lupus la ribonucleoprotein, putative n=1 Tax=Entamoeba dispar (strain ATCC PRA-260 / SAW760) TaxID=370354 RepID=B0EGY7_ENTDS|nr:lupus la ribonucleoprotein, putative [Entamoeba dispar SAW760]EDR26202.1 lupus la ribonucleoprotein, putative [Entamoeba dispar SAW760]|eukprot:EDR26202.1 lupus la ribonucleoprotein, putative [Entamoeba dispar SAW760]
MSRSLIQQIEFYFSDINLSTDLYLQSKMNADGMVPLSIIEGFKMIKRFHKTTQEICEELKQSNTLRLSEDHQLIGRKNLLPIAQLEKRGLKIKWIPCSLNEDEIKECLSEFGEVDQIKMKYIPTTLTFKGTVEVLFKNEATVNKLKEMEKVMVKEKEVIITKWKTQTLWIRLFRGKEKLISVKGIEDEKDGSYVFEIPKGKIQKIQKLKDLSIQYISPDEYLAVLHQRKRNLEIKL